MTTFFPQAGFLQFEIAFGDPAANLATVTRLLKDLAPASNALIALPELWAYGFDFAKRKKLAAQTSSLLQALAEMAAAHDIVLAGSLFESKENGVVFNTLYFVGPAGVLGRYQKQHLFSFWGEDRYFAPGETFSPLLLPLGTVGGLVCYDLRFPELSRDQAFRGAQLIVVSAEWPKVRIDHWQALLRARAIENQVFILACNSYGSTGENELGGCSTLIGPGGNILLEAGENEKAAVVDLNLEDLFNIRSNFCPPGERPRPLQDSQKRIELGHLLNELERRRRQKSRVAFTNGCFDIVHSGHVAYLEQARSKADILVVGLNSDSSVRTLKGPDRPVNNEDDRARILSALACVDYVVIFEEETPHRLITEILPDVLVKGADWEEKDIVGAVEVKAAGGKVERVPFEHDVSTTGLISRIQSQDE